MIGDKNNFQPTKISDMIQRLKNYFKLENEGAHIDSQLLVRFYCNRPDSDTLIVYNTTNKYVGDLTMALISSDGEVVQLHVGGLLPHEDFVIKKNNMSGIKTALADFVQRIELRFADQMINYQLKNRKFFEMAW